MPTPTDSDVNHKSHPVFNYPTLAEAYKVAALDVTNKLRVMTEQRV